MIPSYPFSGQVHEAGPIFLGFPTPVIGKTYESLHTCVLDFPPWEHHPEKAMERRFRRDFAEICFHPMAAAPVNGTALSREVEEIEMGASAKTLDRGKPPGHAAPKFLDHATHTEMRPSNAVKQAAMATPKTKPTGWVPPSGDPLGFFASAIRHRAESTLD
jgi:hypothetical protein